MPQGIEKTFDILLISVDPHRGPAAALDTHQRHQWHGAMMAAAYRYALLIQQYAYILVMLTLEVKGHGAQIIPVGGVKLDPGNGG